MRVELTLIVSGSFCGSSIGAEFIISSCSCCPDWRVSFGDAYFGAMKDWFRSGEKRHDS